MRRAHVSRIRKSYGRRHFADMRLFRTASKAAKAQAKQAKQTQAKNRAKFDDSDQQDPQS